MECAFPVVWTYGVQHHCVVARPCDGDTLAHQDRVPALPAKAHALQASITQCALSHAWPAHCLRRICAVEVAAAVHPCYLRCPLQGPRPRHIVLPISSIPSGSLGPSFQGSGAPKELPQPLFPSAHHAAFRPRIMAGRAAYCLLLLSALGAVAAGSVGRDSTVASAANISVPLSNKHNVRPPGPALRVGPDTAAPPVDRVHCPHEGRRWRLLSAHLRHRLVRGRGRGPHRPRLSPHGYLQVRPLGSERRLQQLRPRHHVRSWAASSPSHWPLLVSLAAPAAGPGMRRRARAPSTRIRPLTSTSVQRRPAADPGLTARHWDPHSAIAVRERLRVRVQGGRLRRNRRPPLGGGREVWRGHARSNPNR